MREIPDDPVDRERFEHRLHDGLLAAHETGWGLFGPTSVVWKVNRFASVNILATSIGGHLDVAHPAVAWGVFEHSRIFTNPKERFAQTYLLLSRVAFGTPEQVGRVSSSLYSRHSRIEGITKNAAGKYTEGSRYAANSVDGLLWVHLVYFWSRYLLYEATVESLTKTEWDRYVDESRRFGACFGLPDEGMPSTLDELQVAVSRYISSGDLAMTPAGKEILEYIATLIPRWARPIYYGFVDELLPTQLTALIDISDRGLQRRGIRNGIRILLRAYNRFAPPSVRYVPAFNEANSRITHRPVGPIVRAFNRALCGRAEVLS